MANGQLTDDDVIPFLPSEDDLGAQMFGAAPPVGAAVSPAMAGRPVVPNVNDTALAAAPISTFTDPSLKQNYSSMLGAAPAMTPPANGLPQQPIHDQQAHQVLERAVAELSQPIKADDPRAKNGWGTKLAALLSSAAMGWGGNVAGGAKMGQGILSEKYDNLEDERKTKLKGAEENLKMHTADDQQQRQGYQDAMTGYRDETGRMSEENRRADLHERDKDRDEVRHNTPEGKAQARKDAMTGETKYFQKYRDGHEEEVTAPEKKPYATPYERSQATDPKEAKQGRSDYDRSEARKDAHENEYESRGDGKGKDGKGKRGTPQQFKESGDKYQKDLDLLHDKTQEAVDLYNTAPSDFTKKNAQSKIDEYNRKAPKRQSQYFDDIDTLGGSSDRNNAEKVQPWEYPWKAEGDGKPKGSVTQPVQNKSGNGAQKPVSTKYKEGDTVTLKGKGKVTITKLNPDGTFEYK